MPCLPSVQARGSLLGWEKLVRSVTCAEREGRREAGMGWKRTSSKALYDLGVSTVVHLCSREQLKGMSLLPCKCVGSQSLFQFLRRERSDTAS